MGASGQMDVKVNFWDVGDPRVDIYPLMSNPWITMIFVVIYVVFAKLVGPILMRNKPPCNIKWLIVVYDFTVMIYSSWILVNLGVHGWFSKYNLRCEAVDFSSDFDALKVLQIGWFYFITKFLECLNTVFLIVSKKDKQVTIGHVLFHGLSPLVAWCTVKYGAGGYVTFYMLLDAFVHTLVYLYYAISSVVHDVKKFLPLKMGLTILQMAQYLIVLLYMLQLTLFPPADCKVCPSISAIIMAQSLIFLALYATFFISTYILPYRTSGVDKYKKAKKKR